jgi:hypothetical protein
MVYLILLTSQPPTPENQEREKILSSLKNITFLYIQAKLRAELIDLHDLLPKFDMGHKVYTIHYTLYTIHYTLYTINYKL